MAQLFGQNKRLIVQGKIAGKGAEQSGLLRDILKTKGNCGFKDIIEASEKMQAANASSGVSVDNRLVENPSLVKLEAERQRIAGIIQVVFAAVQAGRSVKAAFQVGNGGEFKTLYNSIEQSYKGSTRLGHALSKHAGRKPEVWGKVTGKSSTWHNQALKHFDEIMNAPGNFNKVPVPNNPNKYFLEKILPDGRGIRLNMDYTFKGFID